MTTLDGLLADVLADPDADTPRLVYADYLDDVGEHARAAFIRANVELARTPRWGCCDRVGNTFTTDPPCVVPCGCRWAELTRQHASLLPGEGFPGAVPFDAVHCWAAHGPDPFPPLSRVNWVRGFIERVACPAADWLAHGDAIVKAHPVKSVTLTTWPEGEVTRAAQLRRWRRPPRLGGHVLDAWHAEWPRITFTLPPPVRTPEAWGIEVRTPDVWAGDYRLPGMAEVRLRGVVPGDVPAPLVGSVIGPLRARARDGRVYHVPRAVVTETNVRFMHRAPDAVDVTALPMGEFRDVTGEAAGAASPFVVLEPRT